MHAITLCCLLENSYTLPLAMHGFTLQPPSHAVKEDSPLLHYNEYCIVHWCMTKFTLSVTLIMFWSPQLHSFCVHDTKFKKCLQFESDYS